MYSMICTRPYISYALSVSKRTKYMLLVYGGDEELVVNGYTDASFMTDIDDYKS